jgi:hypothetical protein
MYGSKWRREETGTSRASTSRTEPGVSRRPDRELGEVRSARFTGSPRTRIGPAAFLGCRTRGRHRRGRRRPLHLCHRHPGRRGGPASPQRCRRRGAHNRNRRGLRESDRAGSRTMPAATCCPFETGATSTAKPRLADAVVEPVERLPLFEMLPQRRRSIGRRARFEDRPQRATTRGETSATNPTSRRGGVNGSSPLRGLATSRSVVHFPAS